MAALAAGLGVALSRARASLAAARATQNEVGASYADVLRGSNEGVWRVDEHGVTTYVNERMAEMLGYRPEELVGRPGASLLDPVDAAKHRSVMVERAAGRSGAYERRVRHKDGTSVWTAVSSHPVHDADGRFRGAIAFVTDVTPQKTAEARLHGVLDAGRETMLVLRVDGTILAASAAAAERFSLTVSDLVGRNMWDLVPPEIAAHRRDVLADVARTGRPRSWFDRRAEFWFHNHAVPIDDAGGDSVAIFATDVSEAMADREQLRVERDRLRSVLETVETTILTVDREGRVVQLNRKGEEMLGWKEHELVGKNWFETCVPRNAEGDGLRAEFAALVASDAPTTDYYEHDVVTRDEQIRRVAWHVRFRHDDEGRIVSLLAAGIDVTDRRRTERDLAALNRTLEARVAERTRELELARDAAEAASRAKTAFLANASHELRTPLNVVLGFSSLLRDDPTLSPTQREHATMIARSGDHLLTLINDVLEMSRIEAGAVVAVARPTDLRRVVDDVVDMVRPAAAARSIALSVEVDALPAAVSIDGSKLRQILLNLLANAIKYTERGSVVLRGGARTLEGERLELAFEVEDTGVGIDASKLDAIFEPFVQAAPTPTFVGAGLGLAITRRHARMLGGDVTVTSELGRGSTFRVVVVGDPSEAPVPSTRRASAVVGTVALPESDAPPRLLVVDDVPSFRYVLRRIFEPLGFAVDEAGTGNEAIERFREHRPALVFMDRRLPDIDGLEATRAIRALPGGDVTKIVMLTASAFEDHRQEVLDAGCDDFVRKPCDVEDLFAAVEKHLGVRVREPSSPS